jgi:manganese transport protein
VSIKEEGSGDRALSGDVTTQVAASQVLQGKSSRRLAAKLLPFLGPAFIASIAYVDPGNFATNIQAGAQFGYLLLWVILASNLMGILVQTLSAKLGIASGRSLAEMCRERYPRKVVWAMWVLMEVVVLATDLAEFLGAAVGINLLFHIPLFIAGILTAVVTIVILSLERQGFRPLEAVITAFLGLIAVCYVLETAIARPDWGQIAFHAVVPQLSGSESLLLAAGILGATVMPHAIFIHSALTEGRIVTRDPKELRLLFRFEIVDVLLAMGAAALVNGAMLIMAASTFFTTGMTDVGTLEEAHHTLEPLLGSASSTIFGVSLLAAGLSSASVSTMAGQAIMQGFIHRRVFPWVRRLITMIPSFVVIAMGWEPTRTLVLSQVVLSFGLPFAIVPLVQFTSDRRAMGVLVNRRSTTILAGLVAALVIALNVFLIYQTLWGR